MINNVESLDYQSMLIATYNLLLANNNGFDYMDDYNPFHQYMMDNQVYYHIVLTIKTKNKILKIMKFKHTHDFVSRHIIDD
jgi:hypothetical protein